MSTGIFNPDHYPTPAEVAAEMLDSLDLRGKTVLEPSAGSGNLVRECLDRGAAEVLWCEKEPHLRDILTSIKGAVLPETFRRPKTRRRQGVAA
jgi:16S rRNA G966 N2-methylase RsmD